MTQSQSTAYKPLGIAALVLGILAFVFSFVPCLGMYAMYPGIVGLGLGIAAFVMANKAAAAKGMVIASIILSVLGTGVAYWQYTKVKEVGTALTEWSKGLDTMNQAATMAADTSIVTYEDPAMQQSIDTMNNAAQPEPAVAH
ncbi:MAG: DUF4190 domain-containing protein [Sphingobacteriales bacterium]|nr:MAG: DUF4190 domain-containing protein [Sphingobacteriales bacterium]